MKKFFLFSVLIFAVLIILKPDVCFSGAAKGILLSGRVIIPSLFPFTACVLFIMKTGIGKAPSFLFTVTEKIFGITPRLSGIMLLSFTGGYPVGGKLLNEAVHEGAVSPKTAGYMLNYCVNAGPAFVILAVGNGIVGSKTVGYILLFSHLFSSFLLSVFFGFFIKKTPVKEVSINKNNSIADNFVLSVSEAATSVFSISAYVILFSVIVSYLNFYSAKFPFLKFLSPFLEVTNAVSNIRNILFISFLLGFAGLSIWCQVVSVGGLIKINFPVFILSRIAHGFLSAATCFAVLKIFGISVTVLNRVSFSPTVGGGGLSISMLIMAIILIMSLYGKKSTGNILKDIV